MVCWIFDLLTLSLAAIGIIYRSKVKSIKPWVLILLAAIIYEFLTTVVQSFSVLYLIFIYKLAVTVLALVAIQKLNINVFDYKKTFFTILFIHFNLVLFKFLNPNSILINRATIYGSENSEFLIRATGAFVSPGVLSFYSSILCLIFFIKFWYLRRKSFLACFILTLFLGFSTLNRGVLDPIDADWVISSLPAHLKV